MKHFVILMCVLAACSKREPADKANAQPEPVAVAKAAEPAPAPTPAPAADPTPYKSVEGRFTQRAPFGDDQQKTLDDPNGGTWQSTSWKTPSAQLMVQYTDYKSHAHAVAEVHGFIPTRDMDSVKKDEKLALGAHEGREIEWQLPSGTTMWLRFVIADNRVYKIGGGFKGDRADMQKFMDGFAVDAAAK